MACQSVSKAQTTAEEQIRKRWDLFITAWEGEDGDGCSEIYVIDGKNIAPNAKIKTGRASIAKFYHFLFSGNKSSTYSHNIKELDVFGDHAVELGTFTVNWVRNDESTWSFEAISMAHWKKNAAGLWEIEKFMFSQKP